MLDDYKNDQPTAHKIILNNSKNNRTSHAYLFETNGYKSSSKFVISFAKHLLCSKKSTNFSACEGCIQCQKIDEDNFTEIKILKPDGLWIKKDQIVDLQKEFSKRPINGNRKVYIIEEAEKMNLQTANSILKFLEEPEEGIYALLVVDNRYQVLETIASRCQTIALTKKKEDNVINQIDRIKLLLSNSQLYNYNIEEVPEKIISIKNFIKELEKDNNDIFLSSSKYMKSIFFDKEHILTNLEIMKYYYFDVFNLKIKRDPEIFIDDIMELKVISESNELKEISFKINQIIDTISGARLNLNNNLLIDKLIFKIKEYKND